MCHVLLSLRGEIRQILSPVPLSIEATFLQINVPCFVFFCVISFYDVMFNGLLRDSTVYKNGHIIFIWVFFNAHISILIFRADGVP